MLNEGRRVVSWYWIVLFAIAIVVMLVEQRGLSANSQKENGNSHIAITKQGKP
jgi:hypothetical protein